MQRRRSRELLDDDRGTAAEVQASLRDLAWIHRRLGGRRIGRSLLRQALAGVPPRQPLTLLDVGAGAGDLTAYLTAWLRRDHPIRAVALDRQRSHLAAGQAPGLLRVCADGFALPFAEASIDLVTCHLLLHHFDENDVVRLLVEMRRVARHAVVVSDLKRGFGTLVFLRWLGALRFSRLTRSDAPASVAQAFTTPEMEAILCRAGLGGELRSLWPARWGWVLRR